jgi:hypothetical protein
MKIIHSKYIELLKEEIVSMDKIIHLDELSTEQFIQFVKSFINISQRNVEISEKIDGMNFSFGVDSKGSFFSKTKKSQPVTDPSVYGDFSFLDGIKEYHRILNSNLKLLQTVKDEIKKEGRVSSEFDLQIFGELLPSSQTNIVKYDVKQIGKGAIVLFDIKVDGKSILNLPYVKKIFTSIAKKLDGQGGWRVYEKPLLNSDSFSFTVNHLITLETLYRKYFDIIQSRKRADKETKEKAKRVIQALMDNIKVQFLKNMLHNRKSVLGNISPEGLILRDFSNNMLVKLVDKEQFSAENMAGSKYVKQAMMDVRSLNTQLKNDIFGNADIMKNFAKVIEKAVDWAFTNKQMNPNFKVSSLDDILMVAYKDMVEEKRIKYTSNQAIDKTIKYLTDLRGKLVKSHAELKGEKESIPKSKYIISDEKIQAYIQSVDDTVKELSSLKGKSGIKVYLTIMAFVFGPAKIRELKSQFNLTEAYTINTSIRLKNLIPH